MKKSILLTILAFALFPIVNFACSCAIPSSFCESITNPNGDLGAGLIVRGKLIGRPFSGKEIEIEEVIFGEINQDRISMGFGFCTLFSNDLKENEEYIFALNKGNDKFIPIGCAIWFLKIEDEIVKGKITSGIESLPYKEMAFLKNCGNAFSSLLSMNDITIFPNPAANQVKIKNTNTQATFDNLHLKVYDLLGRLISSNSNSAGILPEEIWTINIENLSAGVYIFKLSGKNGERNFRIIKQGD